MRVLLAVAATRLLFVHLQAHALVSSLSLLLSSSCGVSFISATCPSTTTTICAVSLCCIADVCLIGFPCMLCSLS